MLRLGPLISKIVTISPEKFVLYRHNMKDCSARPKPDYSLQLHMRTKIVLFGEMSSGLMN